MSLKTLDALGDVRGKRVLVRSDFNVPLDGDTITDDGRIKAALPTLKRLADAGARVVVMAHLGRPKGEPDPKFSLAPVAKRLGELLGQDVVLAKDTVGEDAQRVVGELADGQVALLENVRFDARETSKDDAQRKELAQEYANLADAYVSDGFGVVHRKQASTYDVAELLPAAAGELVFKEIDSLSKATADPERPYAVVLGGSKVSDKLGVIKNLLDKADILLIGGGMAFTFLKAQGHQVGTSLLEEDQVDTVKGYLATAQEKGVEIVLGAAIEKLTNNPTSVAAHVHLADGTQSTVESDRLLVAVGVVGNIENLGLKNIATVNVEIRRRCTLCRLFNHFGDLETLTHGLAHADDTIFMRLVGSAFLHGDDVGLGLVVKFDHALQAAFL